MSIAQIKALSWLLAALLTLALSAYVFMFISELKQREREGIVDPAMVKATLEDVPPIEKHEDDLIDYEDVKRLFHEGKDGLNWTGQPPPKPTDAGPVPQAEVKPKFVPVADLLRILMIQYDPVDASDSAIFVRYTTASRIPPAPVVGGYLLHVGSKLQKPQDHIRVESITPDAVTFAFDEAGREPESLGTEAFDPQTEIVTVGPDGVRYPTPHDIPTAQRALRPPPGTTQRIGPGHYRLGEEDTKVIGEDYPRFVNEIRPRRHRDPQTGRYDGIEISEVPAGSMAERHGAEAGDVIKSINGHPVTSPAEAIAYAKNNAGKYERWEIVVERRGKEMTIVYESN
jgi:PDZ domain